jgi:2',3'-cyclic-nucleotide 2'-phosphodiesterase (5'-nucleotidase family)
MDKQTLVDKLFKITCLSTIILMANGAKAESKLTLLVLNSFLGQLNPLDSVDSLSTHVKIGGEDALKFHIKNARKKWGNTLLLLDSGNILGQNPPQKILTFYRKIKFDAVALSRKDIYKLSPYKKKYNLPFVLSNLIDIKNLRPLSKNNVASYRVVKKGKYKVGIINVTSMKKFKKGIYIEDPILTVIKLKNALKQKKANLIVLMTDFSSKCQSRPQPGALAFSKKDNFQLKCPKNDPLKKFIKRLPAGSVDIILVNNNLQGQGFLGEFPVIQTPGKGSVLAKVSISYDEQQDIILKDSFIMPPLITCLDNKKNTHCELKSKSSLKNSHGPIIKEKRSISL